MGSVQDSQELQVWLCVSPMLYVSNYDLRYLQNEMQRNVHQYVLQQCCCSQILLFLFESHLNEVQHAGPLAEDDDLLLSAYFGRGGGGAAGGGSKHCCQPHVRVTAASKGAAAYVVIAATAGWPPVRAEAMVIALYAAMLIV